MHEANVLNHTRYSGSLVLLAIVRCQSSILADPTGFASLKWVLSSFANSVQLLRHARVRLGSSSNMPCSNHSVMVCLVRLICMPPTISDSVCLHSGVTPIHTA